MPKVDMCGYVWICVDEDLQNTWGPSSRAPLVLPAACPWHPPVAPARVLFRKQRARPKSIELVQGRVQARRGT